MKLIISLLLVLSLIGCASKESATFNPDPVILKPSVQYYFVGKQL
jgi:uncharacterized lipoprotein YehR (DUF1307 family)